MTDKKVYKHHKIIDISNLRIVSMIPGDREVAGCFIFSRSFGGVPNHLLKIASKWVKLNESYFEEKIK